MFFHRFVFQLFIFLFIFLSSHKIKKKKKFFNNAEKNLKAFFVNDFFHRPFFLPFRVPFFPSTTILSFFLVNPPHPIPSTSLTHPSILSPPEQITTRRPSHPPEPSPPFPAARVTPPTSPPPRPNSYQLPTHHPL